MENILINIYVHFTVRQLYLQLKKKKTKKKIKHPSGERLALFSPVVQQPAGPPGEVSGQSPAWAQGVLGCSSLVPKHAEPAVSMHLGESL